MGFDDDGAGGEGALDAGADGFGFGERVQLRGFVGFEESDAAQGDLSVGVGDLMEPRGNGNGQRVRGDGFEKFVYVRAGEVLVEGAANFFGVETIEPTINARRGEGCDVVGDGGQLPKVLRVGAGGGDEVGKGVCFFGTRPAQGFDGLWERFGRGQCIVKERGAKGCDGKGLVAQSDNVELVDKFKMGADEIFGRVGGVVAFVCDKAVGAFGVAIEFQKGVEFDVLCGREFAQDVDEPFGKRVGRADGVIGQFEIAPAFALRASGRGRKAGFKEEARLGGMILREIGRGVEGGNELTRRRCDEIGGFAEVMDKAEAGGIEFAFLRVRIFLPMSLAVVCVAGRNVFADGKEGIDLRDGGWRKAMRSNEFDGLRLRLREKGKNVLKQEKEIVHIFFLAGIDFRLRACYDKRILAQDGNYYNRQDFHRPSKRFTGDMARWGVCGGNRTVGKEKWGA